MSWHISGLVGRFFFTKHSSDKLTLLCLAEHADKDGYCFPGRETMAQFTCLSLATLTRCVRRLEKTGYLSVKREPNKVNRYQINVAKLELLKLDHDKRMSAKKSADRDQFPEDAILRERLQAIENKPSAHGDTSTAHGDTSDSSPCDPNLSDNLPIKLKALSRFQKTMIRKGEPFVHNGRKVYGEELAQLAQRLRLKG